jgi:hypothetical protein
MAEFPDRGISEEELLEEIRGVHSRFLELRRDRLVLNCEELGRDINFPELGQKGVALSAEYVSSAVEPEAGTLVNHERMLQNVAVLTNLCSMYNKYFPDGRSIPDEIDYVVKRFVRLDDNRFDEVTRVFSRKYGNRVIKDDTL